MQNPNSAPNFPHKNGITKGRFKFFAECLTNPSLFLLIQELRKTLRGCNTVLDIGCGDSSPMRFFPDLKTTGIDGYVPSLQRALNSGTHNELLCGNVLHLEEHFNSRQFDACVALDVIEHLPKEEGWRFLEQMKKLARKKVVIFTPNGFLPQKGKDNNLQEHVSGWTPSEMRAAGFEVVGMLGPKNYRGEYYHITKSPRAFWSAVSILQHYTNTRQNADASAAIYCVKSL